MEKPDNDNQTSMENDSTGEWIECAKMNESVAEYGGFYIARYEMGVDEPRNNRGKAENSMDRNAKIFKVIFSLVALAVIGLILYSKIKSGDFSFTFYF